jgi:subtilisin family serine protease
MLQDHPRQAGRGLAAVALLATVGLAAACGAPPPPPESSDRAPASVVAPPPAATGACNGASASSASAGSVDAATIGADTGAEGLSPAQAGDAAFAAAQQAIADPTLPGEAGSVPVVVTTVDADGRPDVQQVAAQDPSGAADEVRAVAAEAAVEGERVVAVEPERLVRSDVSAAPAATARATSSWARSAWAAASDPRRGSQWALDQFAFEAAWARSSGSGVCVAVVDSGVQTSHPDLTGRVVASRDWTGQSVAAAGHHGTHVAGIIAALAGNGVGVSGAAPGVELLNAKVLNAPSGSGYESWVAGGIIWSVDQGADVINLSLGSPCLVATTTSCLSTTMRNAIDYARFHDVIVVASAGNDGADDNTWSSPAANDWSIATASVSSNGNRSGFSTQAAYVDVAAPGESIWSTLAGDGYGQMSGTSMAAPYVTALAAMVRGRHPGASAVQVRQIIVSTAADRGTAGLDAAFGYGVIDPLAATA